MSESVPNITVLISGNGSNLQSLIDASEAGALKCKISLVISSSSTAYGLTRAEKAGIATKTHTLKSYYQAIPDTLSKEDRAQRRKQARELFNQHLLNIILFGDVYGSQESVAATPYSSGHKCPSLIVCAGWMLILSKDFLERLRVPIINLHPALPGQFEGINAIERSWSAAQEGSVDETGVMIHRVIAEVDRGELVVAKKLPIIQGETLQQYEQRVHDIEHVAIVEGTAKALQDI